MRHKQLLHAVQLTLVVLFLASPATPAAQDGGESLYYRQRTQFVGYPPYPLSAKDRSTLTSVSDLRQAWRFVGYPPYPGMTPAEADALARKFKEQGFNMVIMGGNTYLFRDKKPLKAATVLRAPLYEDLVRQSRAMSDACHKYGLKYFLHLTSTMVDAGLIEDHPDWAAIDIDSGKAVINDYGTGTACFNNDDFLKAYLQRFERLVREAKPDGVMQDEIQFFSPTLCGCHWCRDKFKKDTGYEIPRKTAGWLYRFTTDDCYARWLEWRRTRVVETLQKIRALEKKYNHNNTVITYLCDNSGAYAYYSGGICINDFPKYADSVGLECEPTDMMYQYYWPTIIFEMKYLKAVGENMNTGIWTLFYDRTFGDYTWTWFLAMSQGSRLWWDNHDPAAERCYEPLVAWEEKHERLLMNPRAAANIGVLFSLDCRDRHSTSWNGMTWTTGFSGTCNALTDGQIPYRVLVDEDMTPATLAKKVKTLILLDAGSLSDAAVAAVRAFVSDGGILIASGDTSLFDEKGHPRSKPGLSDVLGFQLDGEYTGQNTLQIPQANDVTGTVTGTLQHAFPFYRVKSVQPDVKTIGWMTLPDSRKFPGILTRQFGKGKVVYFAGHPEFHYFFHYYNTNVIKPGEVWKDQRDPRYGQLLCQTAQFGNTEIPLAVRNLPRGVVAEAYRHKMNGMEGVQVHLVNFLGGVVKEGWIPPFDDIRFPDVSNQRPDPKGSMEVSVLADRVKKVYLISPDFDATVDLPFTVKDQYCTVTLPALYRYSILYFSQGDDREILKLNGPAVKTMPPAKKLITLVREPLAGKYDPKAVTVFADTPDIEGGVRQGWAKQEPAQFLYGSMSDVHTATATLTLKEKMDHPVLEIGGMDDNQPYSKPPIEIRLNGKVVFKGNNTYPDQEWAVQQFPVDPADVRVGKNIVKITNAGKGPRGNIPWFGVSFVRLRPDGTK